MLKVRQAILLGVIGVFSSLAARAQRGTNPMSFLPFCVGSPVLNAPYSATRHFTSIDKLSDGTVRRSESGGSEARDSQGRTYSADERQWLYQGVMQSEMLYRIHDPVANMDTRWDSGSKIVKVFQLSENKSGGNDLGVTEREICAQGLAASTGETTESLGKKTVAGILAEGTQSSYTVPAGEEHNSQPITVVHEVWYSLELKIIILETNDDPRSGSTRYELTDIVRGEPDNTLYRPPADYAVRKVQMTF